MHSLLETYLTEVSSHLGALPGERRAEELREMRGHLEAAYAAGLAQGQSEDEAARDVLTQFGTPHELGAETVAAWRRGRDLDQRSFWGAAACVLILAFLMPHLIEPLEIAFLSQFVWKPFWLTGVFLFFGGAMFLVAGAVAGFFFPRRTIAGIGLAWSVHLVWIFAYVMSRPRPDHVSLFTWSLSLLVWTAVFGAFCTAGAWAGRRWRMARVGRVRVAGG